MKTRKTKPEFAVPVPDKVFVVLSTRGKPKVFLESAKATEEWGKQQQRRNDQLAKGKDTGTDPMLVEYLPNVTRPKSKARKA